VANRYLLLSTTMLSGVIGGVFLATMTAKAADYTIPPPQLPAVDGFNGKIDGLGGSYEGRSIAASRGSLSIPLGYSYGLQIDSILGSYDNDFFGGVGGHLFWRNPAVGLLGLYASSVYWNKFSGVHADHFAAEGEFYWGRVSVQGIAGVETGNSTSVVVGPVIDTFGVTTRFFDMINVNYYLTDDIKVMAGHRYVGGRNALALGGELGIPVARGTMAALFVEGRAGADGYRAVFGGLKFYFGQRDKSLIGRHRQDDPFNWMPDVLSAIRETTAAIPQPPPPPTTGPNVPQ
jgi:hypothetical protein